MEKDITAFLEQFDKELGIFKMKTVLDFSFYHLFKTKDTPITMTRIVIHLI